jgi:hypothetical protein
MYDFENEFNDYYDEDEAKDQAIAEWEQEQAAQAAHEADLEARAQVELDLEQAQAAAVETLPVQDDGEDIPF